MPEAEPEAAVPENNENQRASPAKVRVDGVDRQGLAGASRRLLLWVCWPAIGVHLFCPCRTVALLPPAGNGH